MSAPKRITPALKGAVAVHRTTAVLPEDTIVVVLLREADAAEVSDVYVSAEFRKERIPAKTGPLAQCLDIAICQEHVPGLMPAAPGTSDTLEAQTVLIEDFIHDNYPETIPLLQTRPSKVTIVVK